MPTTRASTSRNSSAPRRRRCTNCIRAAGLGGRWRRPLAADVSPPAVVVGRLRWVGQAAATVRSASAQARSAPMPVAAPARARVGRSRPGDLARWLVSVGRGTRSMPGRSAWTPRKIVTDAVLLADVVLVLAPAPARRRRPARRRPRSPSRPRTRRSQGWRAAAARRVARGLGVGVDRERHAGRQVVGDLGGDRLELAGVAGAVAAEERRAAAGPAAQLGGGADDHRRGGLGRSSAAGTTSATMQVTLSVLPASRLARTSSTAA